MRLYRFILPSVLAATLVMGCQQDRKVRTLKLAHGLDTRHPVHEAFVFMNSRLQELSGGQLSIEIHPNQQLGSERQALELLQIGSVDITKVSGAVMENFAPNYQVLSLPYLFRDREHSYRMQDNEVGRGLLLQSQQYWLRGLTYLDAGQRSFYAKSPIEVPDDLIGKKIRVQESAMAMSLVRLLGGSPTPISWGELYTALQQGVVDGAENNLPSFYTSKHYEICKYYTRNEHTYLPDILLISTLTWELLSPQQRTWLQQAADETKVFQRKRWQRAENDALEGMKKAGVTIIEPNKVLFAEKVKEMEEEFRQYPERYQLIQQIKSIP